ncbi:hypothetical protein MANAM107_11370 [Actinomyces capricornis]|uniref:Uncharacterized protein n=1 Tax=Actinomyces capricornis TaxID=2755559 RepID=A0ABM7UAC5_9ACTO|nr:hypothetical protein MANAM107_11370 [Actinomyces capricornis]
MAAVTAPTAGPLSEILAGRDSSVVVRTRRIVLVSRETAAVGQAAIAMPQESRIPVSRETNRAAYLDHVS